MRASVEIFNCTQCGGTILSTTGIGTPEAGGLGGLGVLVGRLIIKLRISMSYSSNTVCLCEVLRLSG